MKKMYSRVLLSVLALSVCLMSNQFSSHASKLDKNSNSRLAELTIESAGLINSIDSPGVDPRTVRSELARIAEERMSLLDAAINTDPASAQEYLLSTALLAKLPADLRSSFEQKSSFDGELVVVEICADENSRKEYFLNTSEGERLAIRFDAEPDQDLMTGDRVGINGYRVENTVTVTREGLGTDNANFRLGERAELGAYGDQRVLVMLLSFQNNAGPGLSTRKINSTILDGGNRNSTASYFRETSFDNYRIGGEVVGTYSLDVTNVCDYWQIASKAKTAAQGAGVNLSAYDRYMYIYPSSGCGYAGLGVLGGNETWLNGNVTMELAAHELGHNLGLNHARFLVCSGSVIGDCPYMDYGHIMDAMGSGAGHYHSYHKERLGWMDQPGTPSIQTVTQSGVYNIGAYETNSDSAPRALKIFRATNSSGQGIWYYVDLRRAMGFDSNTPNGSNVTSGVMVNLNNDSNSAENYMLDMTPETLIRTDAALTVNRTYTDQAAGISITPLSVSDSGATISVTIAAPPTGNCNQANPTISVSPGETQWIGAGAMITYNVSVKNNNSGPCTQNDFVVQPSLPSGWNSVLASQMINVNPGATGSTTMQVYASPNAGSGYYPVGVGASNYANPQYAAGSVVTCAVYTSLAVSVSTGQVYSANQTAVFNVNVSVSGSPIGGASVSMVLVKPGGGTETFSGTTNAQGNVSFTYRFNKKHDPAGAWTANVTATTNGSSGTGSTSFNVN